MTSEQQASTFGASALSTVALGLMLLTLALFTPGCTQRPIEPKTTANFPFPWTLKYYAGTALSGPISREVQLDTHANWPVVQVSLRVLNGDATQATQLAQAGQPLASKARLITSIGSSTAILPTTSLTHDVRWIDQTYATDSEKLVSNSQESVLAMLSSEATVAVEIDLDGQVDLSQQISSDAPLKPSTTKGQATHAWEPQQVTLSLQLVRPEAADQDTRSRADDLETSDTPTTQSSGETWNLRLALAVTAQRVRHFRARSVADTDQSNQTPKQLPITPGAVRGPRARVRVVREMVIADLPFVGDRLDGSIIVPYHAPGQPWTAVSLTLRTPAPLPKSNTDEETGSDEQPDKPTLIQQANTSLAESLKTASAVTSWSAANFASSRSDLAAAFGLLQSASGRRSALVFLAGRTGATLTGDIALVADDLFLELLAQQIHKTTTTLPMEESSSLGWMMDRAAFELVVQQQDSRAVRQLQGVLLAHLGEMALHPMAMEGLLDDLASRQTFNTHVMAENLISLEDDAPSTRVHAYDWLKAKDQAPANYDPLASAALRRKALQRAAADGAPQLSADDTTLNEAPPTMPVQGASITPTAPQSQPATQPVTKPDNQPAVKSAT